MIRISNSIPLVVTSDRRVGGDDVRNGLAGRCSHGNPTAGPDILQFAGALPWLISNQNTRRKSEKIDKACTNQSASSSMCETDTILPIVSQITDEIRYQRAQRGDKLNHTRHNPHNARNRAHRT